ncbi:MAG: M14 family zinc carboxypeptidase [Candidatus Krumholzibacteria bacterium]|nr:M14 family zinc carboxypeptidase [Candidatus Krumholzibacteria bacterium]
MKRYVVCIVATATLAALLASGAFSQTPAPTAVVRTKLTKEISQKALVERGVDILHVYRDGRADLAVTEDQLAWIESRGALVAVLERGNLAVPAALDENLGQYHTYAEMEAELDALVLAHPSRAHIDTLGWSVQGRVIRSIKISDNAAVDEDEPEVLIMGCHHARELMSVEMPLLYARYLLEHYATDPRVAELVDTREIWIAPMINVDGHVYVEQNHTGSSSYWWRKNRKLNANGSYGIDINRNYGYRWGYDDIGSSPDPSSAVFRGTGPFSEPETQVVRDFCALREFAMSLSYHSYGELILYPWGYAPINTMEQELFAALGDSLRQGNNYLAGNAASGAIYVTNGDSDDWLYGERLIKNPAYAFTVELNTYESGGFAPPESLIQPTFDAMLELNLRFAELAGDAQGLLGPEPPAMNAVTMLNPPSYEISWSGPSSQDPNPAVSYDLVEIKNLAGVLDSVEAGDALWETGGFTLSSSRSFVGSSSFYSGRGDNLKRTLTMKNVYPMWFSTTLACRLWYDVELDWDYAYLEGSADGGITWTTVPGNRTTNSNPNGSNRGNGITGASSGWVSATFDLRSLMVSETGSVLLRFLYSTDASVNNEGLYVDYVNPVIHVERSEAIASNLATTWYHRWPEETGSFIYYVRAFDAEGHRSRMSDLASKEIDDLSGADAPPAFASGLDQNYPNPFNPATTLWFTVGAEEAPGTGTAVTGLRLFDVSGRTVAVLREGRFSAGRYSAVWDGLGPRGKPVASGLYFAELRVGDLTFVRKMVLLK